jgi:leader peptidase (prepilin peptidase)/N-methyltransferase
MKDPGLVSRISPRLRETKLYVAVPGHSDTPRGTANARLRLVAGLALAALVVACFAVFGFSAEAVVNALGCAVLVAITVTDLERRIVPNRIILPALVIALVVQTALDPSVEWIVASLAAGAFYLVAALVYPAGLGMGDVKLAAFLGAWLGAPVIIALFAGSLLTLIPAVVILATQGKEGRKVGIPFAPFLAGGAVIALFFGDAILDAWLG